MKRNNNGNKRRKSTHQLRKNVRSLNISERTPLTCNVRHQPRQNQNDEKSLKQGNQTDQNHTLAAAQGREDYVMALSKWEPENGPQEFAVSEVAFRRGEYPPPSVITVRRWLYLWRKTGHFADFILWPEPGPRGKHRKIEMIGEGKS